jgi:hypothetical protein
VLLVAVAFLLALVGSGITPGAGGGAAPASGIAVLHQPISVVHPSALPQLTATVLHGHPGAATVPPLAVTGTALALALLALAVARRVGVAPAPVVAAARRLPPGRAPPRLPFTR